MSYKKVIISKSRMTVNNTVEGEPIEQKIERMIEGKEPMKTGGELLFTERKEGVRASTNIRTDRWLVAVEGTDKIAKSYKARREERMKPKTEETAKPDSTQGTQQTQ